MQQMWCTIVCACETGPYRKDGGGGGQRTGRRQHDPLGHEVALEALRDAGAEHGGHAQQHVPRTQPRKLTFLP